MPRLLQLARHLMLRVLLIVLCSRPWSRLHGAGETKTFDLLNGGCRQLSSKAPIEAGPNYLYVGKGV